MKTPICSFDAKTGILCTKCESKLKSGHLTPGDIEASMKLTKLAEENNTIDKFTLNGAYKIDQDLVMVLPSSDISIIRSDENLMKKIQKEFNNHVWFIENGATEKRFIENLLYPTKIYSLNLIWLPDGNKLTKIVISANKNKNKPSEEKLKKIAHKLKDIELLIDYIKK